MARQGKQRYNPHRAKAQATPIRKLALLEPCFPDWVWDPPPFKEFGPWIGRDLKTRNELKYISGDDPWDFYLGYNNRLFRRSIWSMIRYKYLTCELMHCPPEVGKLVACRLLHPTEPDYFRGIIVRYNPKAMEGVRNVVVFKVDDGSVTTVFPDDVYCLPHGDLGTLDFQVVRCHLLESDPQLKDRFCEELRSSFKNVLRTSELSVDFIKHDDSYPPRFSVVIRAIDRSKCVVFENLNDWLTNKVIPTLKSIPDSESTMILHLDPEIMDPYFVQVDSLKKRRRKKTSTMDGSNIAKKGSAPATSDHRSIKQPRVPNGTVVGIVASLEENRPSHMPMCQMYLNYGFCRRKPCLKEHIEKSLLWTTEVVPTYDALFNVMHLPTEGSEVLVRIQHLESPVSFYVNLPAKFSNTGEPGASETSAALHADLNSLESNNTHPLLPGSPMIAELVIALGQQQALGPRKKWLRARVVQVLGDTHVEVFFIDFGNKGVVKTRDLRAMRPRFLHLPAQAVLARLHHLAAIPEKREDALAFLTPLILQELKATVLSHFNSELDVHLFARDGACINEILLNEHLVRKL